MNRANATAQGAKVTILTGGWGELYAGQGGDFFGPLNPQAPVAQNVAGRLFDFPSGFNINQRPRPTSTIGFATLRNLADSYDLLRLCIETRKDQMEAENWTIVPVDNAVRGADVDARINKISAWLRRPDNDRRWKQWLRAVLEEVLVTDALSIFVRRKYGGEMHGLYQVDGATIARKIDYYGRTPDSGTAYQQVLKGLPTVDYQAYSAMSRKSWAPDQLPELIYSPRNPRAHQAYGFSPVEQIIATVTIGMARQTHQLSYFTAGNMPESLIGVPDDWTKDQIEEFQRRWDAMLSGETEERRRARFVTESMSKSYTPIKTEPLFGQAEEWLARVTCYAFSLSPQAFSQQMNRATAETAKDSAEDEGLIPLRGFIADLINDVIAIEFDSPDLVFEWSSAPRLSEKDQRTINIQEKDSGIVSLNEARRRVGMPPTGRPEDDIPTRRVAAPAVAPAVAALDPADAKDAPVSKVDGGPLAKAIPWDTHPLGLSRPAARRIGKAIQGDLTGDLADIGDDVAAHVVRRLRTLTKADDDIDWDDMLGPISPDRIKAMIAKIVDDILDMAADAGERAADLVGWDNFDKVNELAAKIARERSSFLISKITETTRDAIRKVIEAGLRDNIGGRKIGDAIQSSFAFSADRAALIAKTEISFANSQSSLETYKAAADDGIKVRKEWLLGPDPCPTCVGNADQGPIDLDDTFESGDDCPPAHPNCVCAVSPVVDD